MRTAVSTFIEELQKDKRSLFLQLQNEVKKRKLLERQLQHLQSRTTVDTTILSSKWNDEARTTTQLKQTKAQMEKEIEHLHEQNRKLYDESNHWKEKCERMVSALETEKWNAEEIRKLISENKSLREQLDLLTVGCCVVTPFKDKLKDYRREAVKLLEIQEAQMDRLTKDGSPRSTLPADYRGEEMARLRAAVESEMETEIEQLRSSLAQTYHQELRVKEAALEKKTEELLAVKHEFETMRHRWDKELAALRTQNEELARLYKKEVEKVRLECDLELDRAGRDYKAYLTWSEKISKLEEMEGEMQSRQNEFLQELRDMFEKELANAKAEWQKQLEDKEKEIAELKHSAKPS